jgi:hypothetical protein
MKTERSARLLDGLHGLPRGYAPRPAGDAPRPAGNTSRAAGGESRPAGLKRGETCKFRCCLFCLCLRGRLTERGRPVPHMGREGDEGVASPQRDLDLPGLRRPCGLCCGLVYVVNFGRP